MININLKDFQDECVNKLLDNMTLDIDEMILKSPTGSGKTIILIDFIDRYLKYNMDTTFIWLSTGNGNLEEQSKKKFEALLPGRNAKELTDVLLNGFSKEDTVFMNWESITKKGNKSIKELERKNLYERIAEGHTRGIKFKVIIDEEHVNKTEKADKLLQFFKTDKIIRVSATPKAAKGIKLIEINEEDVIEAGLITRNLFINENVDNSKAFEDDTEYLLNLAIDKQIEIKNEYKNIKNIKVNPLIVIQFASGDPVKIKRVEKLLEDKGYTYNNNRVAIWLAEDNRNTDDIEKIDNTVTFLLMKQAISTGWDCPRAKILVKLRDNMTEDFEIQTIGRIRRTIKGERYENTILDSCYLYTFDSKYVTAVQQKYNGIKPKVLYLKDEYNNFTLTKEIKNSNVNRYGGIETLNLIKEHFIKKYKLGNDKNKNKENLEIYGGYKFEQYLVSKVAKDKITGKIDSKSIEESNRIDVSFEVNTHRNGIDLQHAIEVMRKELGISYYYTRTIMERLFFPTKRSYYKTTLVNLKRKEFYAFIINNENILKHEIREVVTSQEGIQQNMIMTQEEIFHIPLKCLVKYDSKARDVKIICKNVYKNYTTDIIRSGPERKFEDYCAESNNVEWIYKNGESSNEFFSICYRDGSPILKTFYPDYIVKTKDDMWIIETKGGESTSGQTKNIDKKAHYKFDTLKNYATKHNVKWGFVRDYDANNKLYLNNTEYTEDMGDSNWGLLENFF